VKEPLWAENTQPGRIRKGLESAGWVAQALRAARLPPAFESQRAFRSVKRI